MKGNVTGELADLYASFNTMLDKIQTSASELREARDLLEQRVKDRTATIQEEIAKKEQAQANWSKRKKRRRPPTAPRASSWPI